MNNNRSEFRILADRYETGWLTLRMENNTYCPSINVPLVGICEDDLNLIFDNFLSRVEAVIRLQVDLPPRRKRERPAIIIEAPQCKCERAGGSGRAKSRKRESKGL